MGKRNLPLLLCMLLAACAAGGGGIDYAVEGDEVVVTLTDGSTLRMPCMLASSRSASRIGRDADVCELTFQQEAFVQRREAQIRGE